MTEVEDVPLILLPCGICGRTFRPEVLSKHTSVCQKQHTKKRKKFDSAKQRIQGTDLAEFLGPPPLVNKPKPPSPKKAESKWKEKHEALVRSLRDERNRPGGGKATGAQKEQSKPSDHSQCPHCDRYFGPKAFDRHATWCAEQHSKVNQVQSQDVSKAKLRLEARTKYRAPCFKSQRTVTKEKYLPAGSVVKPPVSSNSSTLPSATPFPPQQSLRRNTSSLSASDFGIKSGGGGGMSPAVVRRNSVPRQPSKQKFKGNTDPEPLIKKPQQPNLPTLFNTSAARVSAGSISLEGSDWKRGSGIPVSAETCSEGANRSGSMGSPPPHQDQSKPVIKTSYSTNRDLESYDPFVTAELQMLELLRSDEEEDKQRNVGRTTPDLNGSRVVPLQSPSHKSTKVLPSAAGSRRSSMEKTAESACKRTQSASAAQSRDLAGRMDDSRTYKRAAQSGHSILERTRSSESGLQKIESTGCLGRTSPPLFPILTSQSPSKLTDPNSPDNTKSSNNNNNTNNNNSNSNNNNNNNIINEGEFKMLSLSTLSLCSDGSLETLEPSLRERRCKSGMHARQSKQRLNMHDLLFGLDNEEGDEESRPDSDAQTVDSNNSGSRRRRRRKVEMERCEAQLLQSMLQFELLLNRGDMSPPPESIPPHTSPPPSNQPSVIDSAYCSLNRRWSPSGDDRLTDSANTEEDGAIGRFCHECGGRYPVPGAKFCCLCGVRRLAV